MNRSKHHQQGFTAVELLITLFIAAAFLIAGYQLFNLVLRDGGQSRAQSTAGNEVYDYVRRYAVTASDPCVPSTPLLDSPVDVEGLSNARITVRMSCPDAFSSDVTRVEATMVYNTPSQTISYATYVNGSATTTEDNVNGLIAWWRLNGNANDGVGSANGAMVNVANAEGQNGQPNNALYFNGSDSYVNTGVNSSAASLTNNFTVSAWINVDTVTGTHIIVASARTASANGFGFWVNGNTLSFTTYGVKDYHSTLASIQVGEWYHVAAVMSSNNVTFYVNGQSKQTVTHTAGGNANTDDATLLGAGTLSGSSLFAFFDGTIDDVRIYDRVLTGPEILSLYQGGAK